MAPTSPSAKTSDPLFPVDHATMCTVGSKCSVAVAEINGRFFITFGHCNFNSVANNADGYATPARARAAIRRLGLA